MLVVVGGMFAIFFFATLYVQQILHLSPVQAGLGFLPLTLGIVLASGLAQALIPRVGVRNVALAGMSIGAVGLLLLRPRVGRRHLPHRRAAAASS